MLCLGSWGSNLAIGGFFTTINTQGMSRIAYYDSSSIRPFGKGFSYPVQALGVYNGKLIVGGSFTSTDGQLLPRLAAWDGSTWSGIGGGIPGEVATAYDVESIGVYNNELYIGGNFLASANQPGNYIARWNGSTWNTVGGSFINNRVRTFCVHNNELYVGGYFYTSGAVKANSIAKWNGSAWAALGTGALNATIHAIVEYGNDIIVGGDFQTIGGVTTRYTARWDGSTWSAMPGFDYGSSCRALAVYNNELYAAGRFGSTTDANLLNLAKWNGTKWVGLSGGGASNDVYALKVFNGGLVAEGFFGQIGGKAANGIAVFNGSTWSAFTSGLSGDAGYGYGALEVYQGELFVGGGFTAAGGVVNAYLAHWGSDAPCIQQNPSPTTVCAGGSANFSVTATGRPQLQYQWYKDNVPLSDGATEWGSVVLGSQTANLAINNAYLPDLASYRCQVSNVVNVAQSTSASLVVCAAECNCDDFVDFVTCFEGGACPPGHDADFNRDGFPDIYDFVDFITAFETGC